MHSSCSQRGNTRGAKNGAAIFRSPNADPQIIALDELDVRVILFTAENALPSHG
jgi:hypothetical protein